MAELGASEHPGALKRPGASDGAAAPDGPGAPSLSLGGFLPYRLSVLAEAVSRAFARHYERRFGVTIPEWRVMAVLGEHSPCATADVIERTGMDRVKVSRAVIRLADKGLVARETRPGDGRAHLLRLSSAGLAMYGQIVPLAHALQAELVAALGADERRALDAALGKLQACADRLAPGARRRAASPPADATPAR